MSFRPPSQAHRITGWRADAWSGTFDAIYACCGTMTMTRQHAAEVMGLGTWDLENSHPPPECPNCVPDQSVPIGAQMPTFEPAANMPGGWLWEKAPELEFAFDHVPQVGYRAFKLVLVERRDGQAWRLSSLTDRHLWVPREEVRARCARDQNYTALMQQYLFGSTRFEGDMLPHEAPWPSCGCGVWAVRDDQVLKGLTGEVVGEVNLWGRVLEFQKGWRAELAYPKSLMISRWPEEFDQAPGAIETMRAALERDYGVPVTIDLLRYKRPDPVEIINGLSLGGHLVPPSFALAQQMGIMSRNALRASAGFRSLGVATTELQKSMDAYRAKMQADQEAIRAKLAARAAAATPKLSAEQIAKAFGVPLNMIVTTQEPADRVLRPQLIDCPATHAHGRHEWKMNGSKLVCNGRRGR